MDDSSTRYSVPSDVRVRESFVLLAIRIFIIQILVGAGYFGVLYLSDLIATGLDFRRLGVFLLCQSFQVGLSLYFFLRWFHRCYDITSTQVISHSGVISAKSDYFSLKKLELIKLKQTVFGVLLGFGTIEITMYFSDHRDTVCLKNISQPKRYVEILEKALKDPDRDQEE